MTVVLRVLAALALALNAAIHLKLADDYTAIGTRPLSLGDQFYAQSAVAIVLALALLIRPHVLVWLATAAFSAVSLAALVVSRYTPIPVPGWDGGWQEAWTDDARFAATVETVALVVALAGVVRGRGQLAGLRRRPA